MSRPAWARGLKHVYIIIKSVFQVAPRVGAWIETRKAFHAISPPIVAPRVGAWIETQYCPMLVESLESRPAWARGLKQAPLALNAERCCRAPRGRVD